MFAVRHTMGAWQTFSQMPQYVDAFPLYHDLQSTHRLHCPHGTGIRCEKAQIRNEEESHLGMFVSYRESYVLLRPFTNSVPRSIQGIGSFE